MRKIYASGFVLALAVFFIIFQFSCQKHVHDLLPVPVPPVVDSVSHPSPPPPPPEDPIVQGRVDGIVVDDKGAPIKDVQITSGSFVGLTDEFGVFHSISMPLHKRFGTVRATKSGFFSSTKTFSTDTSRTNFVRIQLIPRQQKGSFNASAGGTVSAASFSITFLAKSIVDATSNQPYTGTVSVYYAYLDPTSTSTLQTMPGNLRGLNKQNQETQLNTFGMLVAELEGASGQKLQLSSGSHADIQMNIAPSQLASAPDSIPLWYFNDSTGKWMEQGIAKKSGNIYRGAVSHFSYWNLDMDARIRYRYMAYKNFSLRLVDNLGVPLSYFQVYFTWDGYGFAHGMTDPDGVLSGSVVANTTMQLYVLNSCNGEVLYTQPVTFDGEGDPFQNIGDILVPRPVLNFTISGNAIDCDGNAVAHGRSTVIYEGLNYYGSITNGKFSVPVTIPTCVTQRDAAIVNVMDSLTGVKSIDSVVRITSADVQVGTLPACTTYTYKGPFIKMTIDSTVINLIIPPDTGTISPLDTLSRMHGKAALPTNQEFYITSSNIKGIGQYEIQFFNLRDAQRSYSGGFGQGNYVTVTKYEPTGNIINVEGTIFGHARTATSIPVTYTGTFRLQKSP